MEQHEGNPRFEEQWLGVEWHLARQPERGRPQFPENAEQYLLYVFPPNEWAKLPALWVLYSYDRNEVTIHAVNRVSAE